MASPHETLKNALKKRLVDYPIIRDNEAHVNSVAKDEVVR
jgi:hypothetical protein